MGPTCGSSARVVGVGVGVGLGLGLGLGLGFGSVAAGHHPPRPEEGEVAPRAHALRVGESAREELRAAGGVDARGGRRDDHVHPRPEADMAPTRGLGVGHAVEREGEPAAAWARGRDLVSDLVAKGRREGISSTALAQETELVRLGLGLGLAESKV